MPPEIEPVSAPLFCPVCGRKFSRKLSICPEDNCQLQSTPNPMLGVEIDCRYQVKSLLGSGGWSSVYLGQDMSLQRPVAIKILHASLAGNPEKIKRFKQEAVAVSSIIHPNITTMFDCGYMPDGQPYLVMEFVKGETLAKIIATNGPLSTPRTFDIMIQCCSALEAAHKAGIVHRDIKPENILIFEDNGEDCVKIHDFGIARLLNDGSQLTRTGETMGTPSYMSPEQCMGLAIDHKSDIYSLGCVMFECLTGKPPIQAETAFELMTLHSTGRVRTLKEARPDYYFPDYVQPIVSNALEREADKRYENAAAFGKALELALSGQAPKARKVQADRKGNNSLLVKAVVSSAILAAVSGMTYFAATRLQKQEPSGMTSTIEPDASKIKRITTGGGIQASTMALSAGSQEKKVTSKIEIANSNEIATGTLTKVPAHGAPVKDKAKAPVTNDLGLRKKEGSQKKLQARNATTNRSESLVKIPNTHVSKEKNLPTKSGSSKPESREPSEAAAGVRADDNPNTSAEVRLLNLKNRNIDDIEFKRILSSNRNQNRLVLTGSLVTDEGLEIIPLYCPRLGSLWVGGRSITDKGMQPISKLIYLRVLGLRGAEITDAGLSQLKSLHLLYLLLDNTAISTKGLTNFASGNSSSLQLLSLAGTDIDDQAIETIVRNFPHLKRLNLARTSVTSDGIAKLSQLHELQALGLQTTDATDSDVIELAANCKQLKFICVKRARVSNEAQAELSKRGLPVKLEFQMNFVDLF